MALLLDVAFVYPGFSAAISDAGVVPGIMAAAQSHESPKLAALAQQITDLVAAHEHTRRT